MLTVDAWTVDAWRGLPGSAAEAPTFKLEEFLAGGHPRLLADDHDPAQPRPVRRATGEMVIVTPHRRSILGLRLSVRRYGSDGQR